MRTAYFDCFSGVSGDMILGALVDAGASPDGLKQVVADLSLSDVSLSVQEVTRRGLRALSVDVHVTHHGHEHHRGLSQITDIIANSALSEAVKQRSIDVFRRLGAAEAAVHGCSIEEVHFHEVGALDTIVDVVGGVWGLEQLGVDEILFSPISTGSGTVKCAHGILPVPAPATAELLKGVHARTGLADFESATPTGVAILTTMGRNVERMPDMLIEKVAVGAGGKDAEGFPNVLRLFTGARTAGAEHDSVWILEANIDDMTGEQLGFAFERLFAAGAVDVFAQPIQMKKSRPGTLLCAIAEATDLAKVQEAFLRDTSTFGVRCREVLRRKLARRHVEVSTRWGSVRAKVGMMGREVLRVVPEYEDCRRIAQANGVSFAAVYNEALRQVEQTPPSEAGN